MSTPEVPASKRSHRTRISRRMLFIAPGGARSGGSLRRSLSRLPEESSPLDRNDTARIDATHVSSDEVALLDGLGHLHHRLRG